MSSFDEVRAFVETLSSSDPDEGHTLRRLLVSAAAQAPASGEIADAIDDVNGYMLPLQLAIDHGDTDTIAQSRHLMLNAVHHLQSLCRRH